MSSYTLANWDGSLTSQNQNQQPIETDHHSLDRREQDDRKETNPEYEEVEVVDVDTFFEKPRRDSRIGAKTNMGGARVTQPFNTPSNTGHIEGLFEEGVEIDIVEHVKTAKRAFNNRVPAGVFSDEDDVVIVDTRLAPTKNLSSSPGQSHSSIDIPTNIFFTPPFDDPCRGLFTPPPQRFFISYVSIPPLSESVKKGYRRLPISQRRLKPKPPHRDVQEHAEFTAALQAALNNNGAIQTIGGRGRSASYLETPFVAQPKTRKKRRIVLSDTDYTSATENVESKGKARSDARVVRSSSGGLPRQSMQPREMTHSPFTAYDPQYPSQRPQATFSENGKTYLLFDFHSLAGSEDVLAANTRFHHQKNPKPPNISLGRQNLPSCFPTWNIDTPDYPTGSNLPAEECESLKGFEKQLTIGGPSDDKYDQLKGGYLEVDDDPYDSSSFAPSIQQDDPLLDHISSQYPSESTFTASKAVLLETHRAQPLQRLVADSSRTSIQVDELQEISPPLTPSIQRSQSDTKSLAISVLREADFSSGTVLQSRPLTEKAFGKQRAVSPPVHPSAASSLSQSTITRHSMNIMTPLRYRSSPATSNSSDVHANIQHSIHVHTPFIQDKRNNLSFNDFLGQSLNPPLAYDDATRINSPISSTLTPGQPTHSLSLLSSSSRPIPSILDYLNASSPDSPFLAGHYELDLLERPFLEHNDHYTNPNDHSSSITAPAAATVSSSNIVDAPPDTSIQRFSTNEPANNFANGTIDPSLLGGGPLLYQNDEQQRDSLQLLAEYSSSSASSPDSSPQTLSPKNVIPYTSLHNFRQNITAPTLWTGMVPTSEILDSFDDEPLSAAGTSRTKRPREGRRTSDLDLGSRSERRGATLRRGAQSASVYELAIKKPKFPLSLGPGNSEWVEEDTSNYCHQCRHKSYILKLVCDSCSKKYCVRCIQLRYIGPQAYSTEDSDFECPMCKDICNCTACCRKRGEVYISMRTNMMAPDPEGSSRIKRPPKVTSKSQSHHPTSKQTPSDRPRLGGKTNLPSAPPVLKTLPAPSGPVKYWATMYGINGEPIGDAYAPAEDAILPAVVVQRFGEASSTPSEPPQHSKRRKHVFVGVVQEELWFAPGENYSMKEVEPVSWEDRNNGPNERIYIGDKSILSECFPRASMRTATSYPMGADYGDQDDFEFGQWIGNDFPSPLSPLSDDTNLGTGGEGELRHRRLLGSSSSITAEADFASLVANIQEGRDGEDDVNKLESFLTKGPGSGFSQDSLADLDVARAILLGLRACGSIVQLSC